MSSGLGVDLGCTALCLCSPGDNQDLGFVPQSCPTPSLVLVQPAWEGLKERELLPFARGTYWDSLSPYDDIHYHESSHPRNLFPPPPPPPSLLPPQVLPTITSCSTQVHSRPLAEWWGLECRRPPGKADALTPKLPLWVEGLGVTQLLRNARRSLESSHAKP